MTSSSASVHSWVVIQSLPLKSAFTDDLLKSRDVGKVNAPRVADRFGQQLELEIRKHVDYTGRRGAGLRLPAQSLVVAQTDCDLCGLRLEARAVRERVERENVGHSRNCAVNGGPAGRWGRRVRPPMHLQAAFP